MSVLLRDSDDHLYPVVVGKEGAVSVLTVSNTSIQISAFAEGVTLVRVAVAENSHCHYALGTNPTANTTTCSMIPQNSFLHIAVAPGQKLAFIRGANQDIAVTVTELLN